MNNTIFIEIPNLIYELIGIKGDVGYLKFKVDLDDDTPDSCLTNPYSYFHVYLDAHANNQGLPVIPIKLNYEQVKKLMISFNLLGRVGSVLKDFLIEEGLLKEENIATNLIQKENYFDLRWTKDDNNLMVDSPSMMSALDKKQQSLGTKSSYHCKSKSRTENKCSELFDYDLGNMFK